MRITLTAIKADIGSVGGHIQPSRRLLETVLEYVKQHHRGLLIDFRVTYTGDDIAILCTHTGGVGNEDVHRLAWEAFKAGTDVAKDQGLYGAGQDLLKDAFAGNVRGLGPAVAEMDIEERTSEPFLFFAADKTDPGAYNLPLYLAFADPMYCSGLILSPGMFQGFSFTIMDVSHVEADRVITLNAPEELYDMAALLRDPERFVIESIHSRQTGEQAVAVSTTRLHNIAGKYTGKDDPIMLVRVQGAFPATGEVLAPFNLGAYVAGFMRGSHNGPLMPVKQNTGTSFFDGPPIVSCAAYCVHHGRLSGAVDAFDHPYWDRVRQKVSDKATEIRRQGFFGNAMLPYAELEYGGIVQKLKDLDQRFQLR
ncbi:fructose-1,6-bisphosphate aldolase/phosphatase [Desulfosoma caldarium]|uniref:Fructose-1,6-bisphosphate aldolase/phosphatase n=1 Tax=Desulfosoma caldarium TaxID=610254 RepID=A0A3N1VIP7_9BACT|nr:fructose-1,6-bisphosphate aldolase/phosphatase [Desulfosoma caldarium]ROR01780.1 fructose 1,6-bisphosphate aldolase/phosphatase [Desulfosoma caldarium]